MNTNMQENIQENMQAQAAVPFQKPETEYTKRMKGNFGFFGLGAFLYACLYAFCMYKNGSGVTFGFFIAGSLLFLSLCLSKLEISLRKGSIFYMTAIMLLAVSTFCTDDWRIISLNKTGIFLLMMSLLLNQMYQTSSWKLGKYLGSICALTFCAIGEVDEPFRDGSRYWKNRKKGGKTIYLVIGLVISIPVLLLMTILLSSADAVFRELTREFLEKFKAGNLFNVFFRITFMFFASYCFLVFLCKKSLKEQVTDKRKGEPLLAITITSLLTVLYLVFSVIQIVYLFLGQLQLPQEYTYAEYAREGFFQLLIVSILNLIIVLVCLSFFRESKLLKGILTVMSLCTFVMIASSALRMIIYIKYYYLTFLRIFVLWALVVLFLLFAGVIAGIFREKLPLFRYSVTVVSVCYLCLSFSHPDYWIAKVNIANAPGEIAVESSDGNSDKWNRQDGDGFFEGDYYHDWDFLSRLNADAAPIVLSYMEELGYDMSYFQKELEAAETGVEGMEWVAQTYGDIRRWRANGFGYYYLNELAEDSEQLSFRTYNISRHMAVKLAEQYAGR